MYEQASATKLTGGTGTGSPATRSSAGAVSSSSSSSSSTTTASGAGVGVAADSTYFSEFRKGEVNELAEEMKQADHARDGDRMRELIKKVVSYMTLGIDVSRLFSQMIMASNTKDMVQKKLVYLYLQNYAESNPEISLLAINTLQKDCNDGSNPVVRGLALRSLCSLRLPHLIEYILPPLVQGLADPAAYVRRTAVIACVKVDKIAPEHIREPGVINRLYEMLRDKDSQVVSNCICALNELLEDEGGMALNRAIMTHLLNHLKDSSEWTQTLILDLLDRYQPEDEDEIFEILNILEDNLKKRNSAVVFGVIRVFLSLAELVPVEVQMDILIRLKVPLLTMLSNAPPEVRLVVLKHISLLVARTEGLFEDEFKYFYVKQNDPLFVRLAKLQLLTEVATSNNMHHIVAELSELVTDINTELATRAVHAIGALATKLPEVAEHAVEKMLTFLDLEIEHIGSATLVVMKDILRKYPHFASHVIPELQRCLESISEVDARCALVWMLGEFGESIEPAPYLLEDLVDDWANQAASVRSRILTSGMKLFFKRPTETQPVLGALLEKATADTSNQDVHDRALMYYRLLTADPSTAQRVVSSLKEPVHAFCEDDDFELKNRLYREFNSLSVLFEKPSLPLVDADAAAADAADQQQQAQAYALDDGAAGDYAANTYTPSDDLGLGLPSASVSSSAHAHHHAPAPSTAGGGGGSLLDMGGMGAALPPAQHQPPAAAASPSSLLDLGPEQPSAMSAAPTMAPTPPAFSLAPSPQLTPQAFQSAWGQLQAHTSEMTKQRALPNAKEVEALLKSHNLACIASGTVNQVTKVYAFGKSARSGAFLLVEVLSNLTTFVTQLTVKSESAEECAPFAAWLVSTVFANV